MYVIIFFFYISILYIYIHIGSVKGLPRQVKGLPRQVTNYHVASASHSRTNAAQSGPLTVHFTRRLAPPLGRVSLQ